MYEYEAKIVEVIDGDTMWLDIDLGFRLKHNHKIRLARINAPELDTEEGQKVKEFVKQYEGKTAIVKTKKIPEETYDRYVAEVEVDGENLSDLLLQKGLAKPYQKGDNLGKNRNHR